MLQDEHLQKLKEYTADKAGQQEEMKFHKSCEHTGCLGMTWW